MGIKTVYKKNKLPELKKKLSVGRSDNFVSIGIHEKQGSQEKKTSDGDKSPLTLVQVATFHEFGTENVPQRSFIRANDINNKKKYKSMIAEIKDKIIFGDMSVDRGLALLGEEVKKDIQNSIRSGLKPDLKESTIKAKGSSKPLIDTGQLLNGITYNVGGAKK